MTPPSGEVSEQEVKVLILGSRPCCSPRHPHPRHRYSQELLLGSGDAPQLRARLSLFEVKKNNRIFFLVQ